MWNNNGRPKWDQIGPTWISKVAASGERAIRMDMQVWSRHACSDSAPTSDANNNSELDETMSAANPKIEVAQIMGHFLSARHQCC